MTLVSRSRKHGDLSLQLYVKQQIQLPPELTPWRYQSMLQKCNTIRDGGNSPERPTLLTRVAGAMVKVVMKTDRAAWVILVEYICRIEERPVCGCLGALEGSEGYFEQVRSAERGLTDKGMKTVSVAAQPCSVVMFWCAYNCKSLHSFFMQLSQ